MNTSHPKPNSPNSSRRLPGKMFQYRNRRVFVPDGYIVIGQITSVHGLKGELSVELHTDFPERFHAGVVLYMGENLTPTTVEQARPHKANMLMRLSGIESRDSAERLRGLWLYIQEEDAAPLDEGAYWIHDIIGLTVVSEEGVELGQVTDVMSTGANDVYIIQPAPEFTRARELLLPAIAEVIKNVDLEAGIMTVALLPGLIDSPEEHSPEEHTAEQHSPVQHSPDEDGDAQSGAQSDVRRADAPDE